MKRIIGVIFVLLCMLPFNIFAAEKVKVYIFEAGGCPYCEEEIKYLKELDGYNSKFVIIEKESYIDHIKWEEGKDYVLCKKVAEAFKSIGFKDASYDSTPFIVISDIFASNGYTGSLEEIINQAYEQGDKDIVGCIENGNSNCLEDTPSRLDSDTTLKSITVSVGNLSPLFDEEITDYKVVVSGTVEEVNVNAECNGINCKIDGLGIKKLVEGDNEVQIKVTAENGDEQYYRVNIFREENYYKHLYMGVAGALLIIIITLIGFVLSATKNRKK